MEVNASHEKEKLISKKPEVSTNKQEEINGEQKKLRVNKR